MISRFPTLFSTPTRTYRIDIPPIKLFAEGGSSAPYRIVRTVLPDSEAGRADCPFLNRTDPRGVLWIFCQEFNGAHHVLEVRDQDGDGICWRELMGDTPQIMRVLFDHGRSLLPIPGTELKVKPTPPTLTPIP